MAAFIFIRFFCAAMSALSAAATALRSVGSGRLVYDQPINVNHTLRWCGMLMDVSAEHPPKAECPIDVTDSGIVMDVSAEHPSKAECPIDVTESGIVMDVSEEHL